MLYTLTILFENLLKIIKSWSTKIGINWSLGQILENLLYDTDHIFSLTLLELGQIVCMDEISDVRKWVLSNK